MEKAGQGSLQEAAFDLGLEGGEKQRRQAYQKGRPFQRDRTQKRHGNAELQSVPKKGRLGLAS